MKDARLQVPPWRWLQKFLSARVQLLPPALVLPAALPRSPPITLTLPSPVLQPQPCSWSQHPARLLLSARAWAVILAVWEGRGGLACLCRVLAPHCSGTERKGREVELPSGSCWDASGRDPGPRGLWLRWPTQFCLILLSWWSLGFKSLRDSAVTRSLCKWSHLCPFRMHLSCPFQTFKSSCRQAEMYKCVCRWFNMGNHYCPNNLPGHHCKTAKGCEFSSSSFFNGLYTLGRGGPRALPCSSPSPGLLHVKLRICSSAPLEEQRVKVGWDLGKHFLMLTIAMLPTGYAWLLLQACNEVVVVVGSVPGHLESPRGIVDPDGRTPSSKCETFLRYSTLSHFIIQWKQQQQQQKSFDILIQKEFCP